MYEQLVCILQQQVVILRQPRLHKILLQVQQTAQIRNLANEVSTFGLLHHIFTADSDHKDMVHWTIVDSWQEART